MGKRHHAAGRRLSPAMPMEEIEQQRKHLKNQCCWLSCAVIGVKLQDVVLEDVVCS